MAVSCSRSDVASVLASASGAPMRRLIPAGMLKTGRFHAWFTRLSLVAPAMARSWDGSPPPVSWCSRRMAAVLGIRRRCFRLSGSPATAVMGEDTTIESTPFVGWTLRALVGLTSCCHLTGRSTRKGRALRPVPLFPRQCPATGWLTRPGRRRPSNAPLTVGRRRRATHSWTEETAMQVRGASGVLQPVGELRVKFAFA